MQPKNKNTLRAYLTFSARERKAIYLLLVLTVIFFLLPHLFPYIIKPQAEHFQDSLLLADRDNSAFRKTGDFGIIYKEKKYEKPTNSGELFYFDPNKASVEEWLQLGVKEKTAQTIIRYVGKGGYFRKPEDLKKIWGLSPEMVERLIPFVRIKDIIEHPDKARFRKDSAKSKFSFSNYSIDINTSTQQDWESLRGIGPGIASRIIKFREKLGGFISVDQVKETYGLPDSIFQQIRSRLLINETSINQLNINKLELEQLARHPYIRYKTAKAIIAYREQHGRFQKIEDLEKIESISNEVVEKIKKYVTIE